MLSKEEIKRTSVEIINIDMLVPENHLLRKIDKAVDFNEIYSFVEDLYCSNNGRPSVDPVVLFKMVFIQHLYGIRSLRQTVKEIEMNIAYRWFLGYTLNDSIPHFATISYNFNNRFKETVVEKIFAWILGEVEKKGYLRPEVVFIDATHIKANANLKKNIKKEIPVAAKKYEKQLFEEINKDREDNGKKPFDDKNDPPRTKTITTSTTDPDSGLFHKGEHKKCFAYGAHTVCDKNNFVLETVVTPGNIHDSVVFDEVYHKVTEKYPEIQVITADAGYKTPWICKQIFDDGRIPSLPYKRPVTKKGNSPWYEYVFDEYYNCIICPEYHVLPYTTTNRDGYREFKSYSYICEKCENLSRCTESKDHRKVVTKHIWWKYLEKAEDVRHSPLGKDTYALRSQTIERVFADAKEKHAMRYTYHKGLAQVSKWVKLKFAAMNLKKLATWSSKQYMLFVEYALFIRKNPIPRCGIGFFDSLKPWMNSTAFLMYKTLYYFKCHLFRACL